MSSVCGDVSTWCVSSVCGYIVGSGNEISRPLQGILLTFCPPSGSAHSLIIIIVIFAENAKASFACLECH